MMDLERRNGIKKAILGVGVGAAALAGIKGAAAETIVTDDYVSVDGKKFTDAATVVVGRSGNVDYLCGGINDGEKIGEAIAYVSGAGGGTVIIKDGTYTISSTRIVLNGIQNVNVFMSTGTTLYLNGYAGVIFDCTNCSNVSFNGGTFVMEHSSPGRVAYLFKNVEDGKMENISISNAVINDAIDAIIVSSNPVGSIIENVKIRNCSFYGCKISIGINTYGSVLGTIRNVMILNNHMRYYKTDPGSGYPNEDLRAVWVSNYGSTCKTEGILIEGNYIENYHCTVTQYSVVIGPQTDTSKVSIKNNTFKNIITHGEGGAVGIYAADMDEMFVCNNVFENIGFTGDISEESSAIHISGDNVSGYGKGAIINSNYIKNVFTGSTGSNKANSEGIYCKSYYADISNNVLIDGGDSRAIVLKGDYGAENSKIDGNIVIYVDREPFGGGISSSTSNSIISNNIIGMQGSQNAIELLRKVGFEYIVKNNYCRNANVGVGQGIYGLTATPNVYLDGNVFYGTLVESIDQSKYILLSNNNNYINGSATNPSPNVTSGSGAPTTTPVKIGDVYIDTATPALYYAKGTASSADWVLS